MANISNVKGDGGILTDLPTFKMSMKEYEDMSIKVGDKVMIEIKNQIIVEFNLKIIKYKKGGLAALFCCKKFFDLLIFY
jgi:hypothetical protein